MKKNLKQASQKARAIRAVVFDVDGVLTDGNIYFTPKGEYKAFNSQDGLGIKMLLKAGIEVGIITARTSELVTRRMQELGVRYVFQGQKHKLHAFTTLQQTLNLAAHQLAYVGDDLNDIAPIRYCGFGIAVANASPLVHQYAAWSTLRQGGAGAVREVCEFILSAQHLLEPLYEHYL